jgi:hypothetical protein
VGRSFRYAPNSLHQFFPAQPAGPFYRSSLHQFRECRTAGHGGNTSFRKKADFRDLAVCNLHGEFQNVAAGWIFDLHGRVRIGDFARVARMLEVIQKLGRIHPENCNVAGTDCRNVACNVFIFAVTRRFQILSKIGLSCLPTIAHDGLSLCNPARL